MPGGKVSPRPRPNSDSDGAVKPPGSDRMLNMDAARKTGFIPIGERLKANHK